MMHTKSLLKLAVDSLDELKATEITTLDVKKLTTITDFMVICSGRSTRHVKSIADNLIKRAKERAVPPFSSQGEDTAEWVVVDLGAIIVHIMLPEKRDFYELEKIWATPKRTRKSA